MIADRNVRRAVATQSPRMFFGTYFGHYIKVPFADFHHEMFRMMENPDNRIIVITGARSSAKSTVMNMNLALWSILGAPQKKFVIILSHTQIKAKQHFTDLRKELEENKLLRSDLGPFRTEESQWSSSLSLPKYDAQITFASTEQSVRGMRHKQYRPDLIIGDDLEDNESVKTLDSRNKIYEWLTTDVIPAGDQDTTRLVIIGTLLHEDSLMMRLKKEIQSGQRNGVYREYPLIDENGNISWKGKYPDDAAIEALRRFIGNDKAFSQEYLLKIISDSERVIHPEWIHTYKIVPPLNREDDKHPYRGVYIGMDLAISEKEKADKTAMIAARMFGWGDDMRIYILPNQVNERLDFPSSLEKSQIMSSTLGGGRKATMYIENNQFQGAWPQMLQKLGYPAIGVRAQGDKRSRLALISHLVKQGIVLFPETGAEEIIQQITGLGSERYDDLADALSLLVSEMAKLNKQKSKLQKQSPNASSETITGGMLDMIF